MLEPLEDVFYAPLTEDRKQVWVQWIRIWLQLLKTQAAHNHLAPYCATVACTLSSFVASGPSSLNSIVCHFGDRNLFKKDDISTLLRRAGLGLCVRRTCGGVLPRGSPMAVLRHRDDKNRSRSVPEPLPSGCNGSATAVSPNHVAGGLD